MSTLPTDAKARKNIPVATGCVDYFPDALAAVAELSRVGHEQHNPGTPLRWDRSKSGDESDALMRHFLQRGTIDSDGIRHSAKVAWRALALLQKELEAAQDRLNAAEARYELEHAAEEGPNGFYLHLPTPAGADFPAPDYDALARYNTGELHQPNSCAGCTKRK